jgi:hypothetical protein
MKTVEHFDGSYGVTTDEQFGELVDFLNGKEVVEEYETESSVAKYPLFSGAYTEYRIAGQTYRLFHQVYTPNTPEGSDCAYYFRKVTQ